MRKARGERGKDDEMKSRTRRKKAMWDRAEDVDDGLRLSVASTDRGICCFGRPSATGYVAKLL